MAKINAEDLRDMVANILLAAGADDLNPRLNLIPGCRIGYLACECCHVSAIPMN